MKPIQLISKFHHDLILQTTHSQVEAPEDAVIIADLDFNFIEDIYRQGEQAIIEYKQQKIVVHEFFSEHYQHDLILKDVDGGLFQAQFQIQNGEAYGEIKFVKVSSYSPLLYSDSYESNVDAYQALWFNQALQQKNNATHQ